MNTKLEEFNENNEKNKINIVNEITHKDFLEFIYNIYSIQTLEIWINNNLININYKKKIHNIYTIERIFDLFYDCYKDDIFKNKILFSNILKNVIKKIYNINLELNSIVITLTNIMISYKNENINVIETIYNNTK